MHVTYSAIDRAQDYERYFMLDAQSAKRLVANILVKTLERKLEELETLERVGWRAEQTCDLAGGKTRSSTNGQKKEPKSQKIGHEKTQRNHKPGGHGDGR